MLLIVIGSISFSVLANNIETKADLEKMVSRYEKTAQLGTLCISSNMKDVHSCNTFQKVYLSELAEEFKAMPDKLSSYIDIDMDITFRGIAAITSITESIFVIVRKTAGAESMKS
jgi:hypothetical protein